MSVFHCASVFVRHHRTTPPHTVLPSTLSFKNKQRTIWLQHQQKETTRHHIRMCWQQLGGVFFQLRPRIQINAPSGPHVCVCVCRRQSECAVSQEHDLSAVGLFGGQEGDKKLTGLSSCLCLTSRVFWWSRITVFSVFYAVGWTDVTRRHWSLSHRTRARRSLALSTQGRSQKRSFFSRH